MLLIVFSSMALDSDGLQFLKNPFFTDNIDFSMVRLRSQILSCGIGRTTINWI